MPIGSLLAFKSIRQLNSLIRQERHSRRDTPTPPHRIIKLIRQLNSLIKQERHSRRDTPAPPHRIIHTLNEDMTSQNHATN